ncbi:ATP-binding response regulator [Chitinophaga varians]|uniref:ATP-binding response regulator n=1 Tax=Chitinophaga varians TaxID=2202339 RepID=UPI00165F91BE|nr:response regulator [Chitinophaga varians]MBC9914677.1 response regulator [Chitinophaga varians]
MHLISSPTSESVFRRICYLISVLSLTLGLYVYRILEYEPIKYIEISFGIFFLVLPYLTKKIGLSLNISIFFVVLNGALCFYGILLGPISEIPTLVAFLLGVAVFLLRGKKLVFFPVSLAIGMLFFLELNYYYNWFAPLPMAYTSAIKVRWVVIFTGCSLSAVTVFYFVKRWTSEIEKNRKMAQRLLEANVYKTKFLRETSHELRTPLSNIMGIAEFFNLYKNDFPDDIRKEVNNLLESAHLAEELVNNHLDLARIEAGKYNELNPAETVNLKFAFDTCIGMQRVIANTRKVKLDIYYDDALPEHISVDKLALYTIINNLSSNLVKHTGQNNIAQIKIYQDGERLIIETKNAGHIAPDKIHDIFKPFVSTNQKNSTGLGLPIIKHIAKLMEGDVYAYTLGEFVIFRFEMPLIIAGAPKVKQGTQEIKGALQGYKILCIDDDHMSRSRLERNIKHTGAKCMMLDSALPALEVVKRETPNVIICDMTLPKLSGIDFAKQLKQHPYTAQLRIPIIFLSADVFSNIGSIKQETGLDDIEFLRKPYSDVDLYSLLTKYLVPVRIIVRDSA